MHLNVYMCCLPRYMSHSPVYRVSVVAKLPATKRVFQVGAWNGHAGAARGVWGDASGRQGIGIRNKQGERGLEFAIANLIIDYGGYL